MGLSLAFEEAVEVGDDREIVVADNGVRIGPDDRQRIFAPFQRGTNANGNGLGLVPQVVEDVGGQLTLAPSEHGARFVIDLPTSGTPEDCSEMFVHA